MAGQTTEEILKFVVQATGNESLTPIVRSILDLSGNSAEAEQAVGELLTQLSDSQKLTATLDNYRKVGASVLELSKQYDAAKLKVAELGKNLSDTDEPTKKQQAEFEKARAALAKLGTQYDAQLTKLRGYRSELTSAGVSTSSFSTAQAQLKARATEVTTALSGMAAAAKSTKDEQSALAARLADGDEAFRRQAEASKSAREALDRVKASTTAAAQAQQEAAGKSTVLGAAWTKLAAIGATLAGYLTINAAVQGVKNLLGLADASEKTRIRLAALYGSQEAGNKAFADLRALSQATGQEFAATAEAAARLKAFGIEPLNGSLQALIDQNARVGGSQETLNGLILAVGQAWAKQKLQGEEILQLVERGVPVWDLLSKATGKNVTELQKLSEAGKLGRAEIAKLVQEIGASASGAAAQNLGTFGGIVTQLKDQWQQFLQSIADAGVLQYAKDQISALIDEARRLAADGTLTAWAKSTADGIKSVVNVVVGAAKVTYEYSGAVIALGQAYATIKVTQLVADLGMLIQRKYAAAAAATALGSATTAASGTMGGLAAAIGRIPTAVKIGIGVIGAEAAFSSLSQLADAYEQLRSAQAKLNIERQDLSANEAKLIAQIEELKNNYAEYADTAIRSSAELRELSNDQADAYQKQLEGARRYFQALEVEARRANDAASFNSARQKLVELGAELGRVKQRFSDLAAATTVVQPKVNEFAQALTTAFQTAYKEGANAAQIIREEFGKIDVSTVQGLTDAVESIREIGKVSAEAGAVLQRELRDKLIKLSDSDLQHVREAAEEAFQAGSLQAEAFGAAVAGINLERLGVDLQSIQTGFSEAGGAAVAAFAGAIDEVDKLGLTAAQQSTAIAQAFDAAFARANTRPELEALREQLVTAFEGGKISAAEYERALAALNSRLEELANKSKPAADKTREVSSAMRDAANAADDAGDSTGKAAKQTENWGKAAKAAKVDLGNLSAEMLELAMNMQSQARSGQEIVQVWKGVTDAYNVQNKAVQNRIEVLRRVVEANDEESRSLERLKKRYDAINDGTLKELSDLQREFAEIRRKQAEQTNAAAEAEREYREELEQTTAVDPGGDREYSKNIRVEVLVRADASAGGQTLSQAVLDQIVAKITPVITRAVLDELETNQSAAGY